MNPPTGIMLTGRAELSSDCPYVCQSCQLGENGRPSNLKVGRVEAAEMNGPPTAPTPVNTTPTGNIAGSSAAPTPTGTPPIGDGCNGTCSTTTEIPSERIGPYKGKSHGSDNADSNTTGIYASIVWSQLTTWIWAWANGGSTRDWKHVIAARRFSQQRHKQRRQGINGMRPSSTRSARVRDPTRRSRRPLPRLLPYRIVVKRCHSHRDGPPIGAMGSR